MLNPFASVRASERRAVLGALLTLWGIMAGHALLETARDSLFLASLGAERLPWVYLAIAAVALGILRLQTRAPLTGGNRRVLAGVILLSAALTGSFWLLLARDHPAVLFGLYIWSGVYATLVVSRFWILVEDVFTVTQAKRVFALIGAGSVLGAITGSAAARALAEFVEPRHFLLAALATMVATGLAPLLLLRGESEHHHHASTGESRDPSWKFYLRMVTERPYVKRLLLLVLLSSVVLTLTDYLFKSIVAQRIAAEDMPGFFSTTYLSLNLLSLLLQLTVVSVMLRSLGLHRVLSTLPSLLIVGAAAVIAFLALWSWLILVPAIALKLFDGSLRHSLHRTAVETLFVPLSRELRDSVKSFVDIAGQRGGQALASAGILAVVLLPHTEAILAVVVIVLCGWWIHVASDMREHYLDLFRDTLSASHSRARIEFPELDLASLETLIERLNSSEDTEVLAALDLLAEQERVHLIPALILYHPSPPIVQRALELFAAHGRVNALSVIERMAQHEDATVRAAVLRARAVLAPDVHRQLREFLDDESPLVRATALITLVAENWIQGDEAEKAMRSMASGASREERLALLKSIEQQPEPIHTSLVVELADTEDEELRLMAARAMAAVRSERFLPLLREMLPMRRLRAEARHAFVAIGAPALEFLDRSLADHELPSAVRRHVPRSIHRFDPELAAPILMRHLVEDPDGHVRYKILRALGALRSRAPHVELDEDVLERAAMATLEGSLRLLDWKLTLEDLTRKQPARRTPVQALLMHTLEQKESHAVERLFRLLGLLHPDEDWETIYRGLHSDRPSDRASSMELIEAALQPPLRDVLLGFVDDVSDAERLRRGRAFYAPRRWSYEEILAEFLERGSLGLRGVTLYHIGELGLERFRAPMLELTSHPSESQREIAERALELLDAAVGADERGGSA